MRKIDKFAGCDRILCVKSWDGYEVGRVYNCKLDNEFLTIGAKEYLLFIERSNSILESFITLPEHRRTIIESFL